MRPTARFYVVTVLLGIFPISSQRALCNFSYSTPGATVVIDFTGYTGAGFQSVPAAGQLDSDFWAATGWSDGNLVFGESRIAASTDYTRGASASAITTGGFYAFTGTPGGSSTNPSFGIQPGGGDWAPGTLTFRIQNTTGFLLESGSVGYDLFVRNDQSRSNSFNFSYATNATGIVPADSSFIDSPSDAFTSLAASDALGFVQRRSSASLTSLTSLGTVATNNFIFLRWSGADVGGSGSRDEFALDNITFSFTAVPEPASLAGAMMLFGMWVLRRRSRSPMLKLAVQ